jgi:DNA-3-methyladenine glycosylase II
MSLRRFRVAEKSMAPTFLPGDEFVANTKATPQVGDPVAAEHPDRPDFWLLKRLAGVPGDIVETSQGTLSLGEHDAWVLSDNSTDGARDSRDFGPVDINTVLPVVQSIDHTNFRAAIDLLVSEDDDLAAVVERWGVPEFWARPRGFRTLTILILEQQVSLESAAAVFRRLQERVGEVSAENILSLTPEELNQLGLTRQKSSYVLDLAAQVHDGSLDLGGLDRLNSADAAGRLEEIRGVGRWTAEAYLLSAEGRPDIFPVGDRALQVATGECLGLARVPPSDELELLSQPWKPIRSVAARLLWHDYLSRRGRSEPSH